MSYSCRGDIRGTRSLSRILPILCSLAITMAGWQDIRLSSRRNNGSSAWAYKRQGNNTRSISHHWLGHHVCNVSIHRLAIGIFMITDVFREFTRKVNNFSHLPTLQPTKKLNDFNATRMKLTPWNRWKTRIQRQGSPRYVVIILYKIFAHSQQDRSTGANTPFSRKLITQTLPTCYKQKKLYISRNKLRKSNGI